MAQRESASAPFDVTGSPTSLSDFGSQVYSASLTGDGRTLYFQAEPSGSPHIYAVQRDSRDQDFLAPLRLKLDAGLYQEDPRVRADGRRLYFVARSRQPATRDLYMADRVGAGFGEPQLVPVIADQPGVQGAGVVTPDDLTLYFASSRPGGVGGFDIWLARRSSGEDDFAEPVSVTELNSAQDEVPDFVTSDGCTLYFHSSRPPGAATDLQLYVARKPSAPMVTRPNPDETAARCEVACVTKALDSCRLCHSGSGGLQLGMLDLTSPGVTARLLDVQAQHVEAESRDCPRGDKLIDSQAPDSSWLLKKLHGLQGTCGDRMPKPPIQLDAAGLGCLETYVACVTTP
jgi:hypothetical protein